MGNPLPHLVVRTDCSPVIGIGHFTRCLALARAWRYQGGEATFVGSCASNAMRSNLLHAGIDLIPLDFPHPHPTDAAQLCLFLDRLAQHLALRVVLDGYHFDTAYQQLICRSQTHVLVIDDMNHLRFYEADMILNPNMHAQRLNYCCGADTRLLVGPAYVLLRPEFSRQRPQDREIPSVARKLLVTLGGSDPDNVTAKVVEALQRLDIYDLGVTVVIGPANPHGHEVEKQLQRSCFKWRLLRNPDNLPELMASSDLAISAGGSTCWELVFMGLPTLVIVTAENQRGAAMAMAETGAVRCLGTQEKNDSQYLADAVTEMVYGKHLRSAMSRAGRDLVDGKGAERVVEAMLSLP